MTEVINIITSAYYRAVSRFLEDFVCYFVLLIYELQEIIALQLFINECY